MNNSVINLQFIPSKTFHVLDKLCESRFIKDYTLVGGTALAMQIEHRMSEDLDFVIYAEKLNIHTIKRNNITNQTINTQSFANNLYRNTDLYKRY